MKGRGEVGRESGKNVELKNREKKELLRSWCLFTALETLTKTMS